MNIARKPPPIEPLEDDAARDRRLLLEILDNKQAELDAANRDKTGMQRIIDEIRYWRRIQAENATQAAKAAQLFLPLVDVAN